MKFKYWLADRVGNCPMWLWKILPLRVKLFAFLNADLREQP